MPQFEKHQNSSAQKKKKKKDVEQASDNAQRYTEYKGAVIQKQDAGVCEQQTWVERDWRG